MIVRWRTSVKYHVFVFGPLLQYTVEPRFASVTAPVHPFINEKKINLSWIVKGASEKKKYSQKSPQIHHWIYSRSELLLGHPGTGFLHNLSVFPFPIMHDKLSHLYTCKYTEMFYYEKIFVQMEERKWRKKGVAN